METEPAPLEALQKLDYLQFSSTILSKIGVKKLPSQSDLKHRLMCDCGRTFLHSAHVRYHKRWECGKVLSCRICGRKFVTISNLKRHFKGCKGKEEVPLPKSISKKMFF